LRFKLEVNAFVCPPCNGDTVSKCPACYECKGGLRAADSNYIIISFKLRGENLCDDQTELERENTGATWNEARAIINKACPNSIVTFFCISAKNKKGEKFVLQPFTLKL
jgi:hypothetical protein